MGAAQKRKAAFLADNPICCFCGGTEPATTIDHVPLRAAFLGKVGPEGFEFPSCQACNSGTAGSEQVFALYARLLDHNDSNYNSVQLRRLIDGVRNNYPDLVPRTNLSATEKRRILQHWGWELPRGAFLDDVGLVALSKKAGPHLQMNTVKLLAALHYRHAGTTLTAQHATFTGWSQLGLPGVDEAQAQLLEGMPELVVGARTNTSIGNQFAYRWGQSPDQSLFGFAAGFGTGLFVMGAAAPLQDVENIEGWLPFQPPRSPQQA